MILRSWALVPKPALVIGMILAWANSAIGGESSKQDLDPAWHDFPKQIVETNQRLGNLA